MTDALFVKTVQVALDQLLKRNQFTWFSDISNIFKKRLYFYKSRKSSARRMSVKTVLFFHVNHNNSCSILPLPNKNQYLNINRWQQQHLCPTESCLQTCHYDQTGYQNRCLKKKCIYHIRTFTQTGKNKKSSF